MRGAQASEEHEREHVCAACGLRFIQKGPGRNRKVCYRGRCEKRAASQRRMGRTMFGTVAPEGASARRLMMAQESDW